MAQSQSQPADSQPANAVLASSLFVGLDFDVESHDDRPILRRTGTGCMAIDAALDGGIAHGKGGVCCISGDRGVGKTGVSGLLFHAEFAVCRFAGIGGIFVLEYDVFLHGKLEMGNWVVRSQGFVMLTLD